METLSIWFLPDGGEVSVDLSGANSHFEVEWFDPKTGESVRGEAVGNVLLAM